MRCIVSPKKIRYRSLEQASRVSLMLEVTEGERREPYKCSGCNGWHLATAKEA